MRLSRVNARPTLPVWKFSHSSGVAHNAERTCSHPVGCLLPVRSLFIFSLSHSRVFSVAFVGKVRSPTSVRNCLATSSLCSVNFVESPRWPERNTRSSLSTKGKASLGSLIDSFSSISCDQGR